MTPRKIPGEDVFDEEEEEDEEYEEDEDEEEEDETEDAPDDDVEAVVDVARVMRCGSHMILAVNALPPNNAPDAAAVPTSRMYYAHAHEGLLGLAHGDEVWVRYVDGSWNRPLLTSEFVAWESPTRCPPERVSYLRKVMEFAWIAYLPIIPHARGLRVEGRLPVWIGVWNEGVGTSLCPPTIVAKPGWASAETLGVDPSAVHETIEATLQPMEILRPRGYPPYWHPSNPPPSSVPLSPPPRGRLLRARSETPPQPPVLRVQLQARGGGELRVTLSSRLHTTTRGDVFASSVTEMTAKWVESMRDPRFASAHDEDEDGA